MPAQKPDKVAAGQRIREAREAKGWTQIQLAGEVGGMTNADVWRYEDGRSLPGHEKVEALAKALGVTTSWILWGEERDNGGAGEMPPERRRMILAWAKKHGMEAHGSRMVEMLVGWGDIDEADLMTVAARAQTRGATKIPANKAALSKGSR